MFRHISKATIAEGLELVSLLTLACTGFSPNHYRLFQFVLGWTIYGLDKKMLKSQLKAMQTLPSRVMRPEMLFGLVGAELYEVTAAQNFWKAKLGRRLEISMQRAYYQGAPRMFLKKKHGTNFLKKLGNQIWDWQPRFDFRASDFEGPCRIYVWGPPHLVNHSSESHVYLGSGTFVHDCNYM